MCLWYTRCAKFLSTPSARRATCGAAGRKPLHGISIHALREEGDRHIIQHTAHRAYFYPRPPRGGRRGSCRIGHIAGSISIHALREEGDHRAQGRSGRSLSFLSTPSARRATKTRVGLKGHHNISIHALREEGDCMVIASGWRWSISIHALREEGDVVNVFTELPIFDFYPRPPRGGRPGDLTTWQSPRRDFYPRPPRGGRHCTLIQHNHQKKISIHALREEGDEGERRRRSPSCYFYPRPPRGGRPIRCVCAWVLAKFLSTPSARRAT